MILLKGKIERVKKNIKLPLFNFMTTRFKRILGSYDLVIGDINTGEWYLDETKASFHCVKEFKDLKEKGLIDSWGTRNPDKKEFSWYSKAGNGFRIDHVFSTPEFDKSIKNIFYSHRERENGVSDHSALIVEYG